jgi:hypothetical protein
MEFNERELATVLAALRHFQPVPGSLSREELVARFPQFEDVESLDWNEVNVLCAKINDED